MLPECSPRLLQDSDFMFIKCSEKDDVLYKTQELQTPNHTILWKPNSDSTHFTYIHNISGDRNASRKCIFTQSAHKSSHCFKVSLLTNPLLFSTSVFSEKLTNLDCAAFRKWVKTVNGYLWVFN